MTLKVAAKLNLSLNVSDKVTNNYHMLESVLLSINIYDMLSISKTQDDQISVYMDGIKAENNNTALIAAQLLSTRVKLSGMLININKGIPQGAGLGGSSADAAAVIVGISKMFNITNYDMLDEVADMIGSDVKYMLSGGLAYVTGRGTIIERYLTDNTYYFVLVSAKQSLSTKQVFAKFDCLQSNKMNKNKDLLQVSKYKNTPNFKQTNISTNCKSLIKGIIQCDMQLVTDNISNNLIYSAFELQPDLINAYKAMQSCEILSVSMTGSGSSLFALCRDLSNAEMVQKQLAGLGINAKVCNSVNTGIEIIKNDIN